MRSLDAALAISLKPSTRAAMLGCERFVLSLCSCPFLREAVGVAKQNRAAEMRTLWSLRNCRFIQSLDIIGSAKQTKKVSGFNKGNLSRKVKSDIGHLRAGSGSPLDPLDATIVVQSTRTHLQYSGIHAGHHRVAQSTLAASRRERQHPRMGRARACSPWCSRVHVCCLSPIVSPGEGKEEASASSRVH